MQVILHVLHLFRLLHFTRLRENVQFFFVPYSQLWKYFNTQVLNMDSSASGHDVSRIAKSPFSNEKVSTRMPYISYSSFA